MNRTRKPLITFILLILSVSALFAVSYTGGSADHVLLFYPRSSTTDTSSAIELSAADSLTTMGSNPLDFSATSTISAQNNNLAIFRIYDTLANEYMSIPSYAGYRANDYDDKVYIDNYSNTRVRRYTLMFGNVANSVTLNIHTTGIFVKMDEPGITRDFSLSCIMNEAHINNSGTQYVQEGSDQTNVNMTSGQEYSLLANYTGNYAKFTNKGNGDYELYCPSTPTVAINSGSGYYYPLYQRLFDICIKLAEPKATETLKPGYYSTTITITSESTYTNLIWRGTKGVTGENRIDNDVLTMQMSQTITVYGYISGSGISEPTIHSISINPGPDTYSMNLSDTTALYNIANVNYHASDVLLSTDTKVADILPNTPERKTERENYYKIYITPNNKYVPGTTEYGDYEFTRRLDKTEKIKYDLYMLTGAGGATETAFKDITSSTKFPSTSVIGYAVGSTTGDAFYIVPRYTLNTETYNNNSATKYSEFWDISDINLYLKVIDDSTTHTVGEYTSTIYFTLVAD